MLALEELMTSIRGAKKEEMMRVRDKLTKLEMSLSFSLENEELDPHIEAIINDFLIELTQIIDKTNKIY